VIPAYNEEDRIGPTIRDLVRNIDNINEILVVFDGNDNTPAVAESFGPKVQVLKYNRKLGRGGAVLEGLQKSNYRKVCFIDADNSAPWFEVKRLADMIQEGNKCVIASRWTKGSKIKQKEGPFKMFFGRVWRYLTFFLLRLNVKDAQCGLKCFDSDLLEQVLPKVKTTNRMFDVSLLYNVVQTGYDIKEVGIEWSHNQNTRMPYVHVIPMMFLYLFGLRFAHSPLAKKFPKFFEKVRENINEIH
jgi:glycosyltransferase involved in cell wall biosynthesis